MIDSTEIIRTLRDFYQRGWMPGSFGGLACLQIVGENSKKVYMTPDRFDATTLSANDLFVMRDLYGSQDIQGPLTTDLKITRWGSIFLSLIAKTQNNCIGFFSTKAGCLAGRVALHAWRSNSETHPNVVRVSHWGLNAEIGQDKEFYIPIIEMGAIEELITQVNQIFNMYSEKFPAIIVRNYGYFIWGETLAALRNRTDILERLLELQSHAI